MDRESLIVKPSKRVQQLNAYAITPQDVWSGEYDPKILKADWNEAPRNLKLYFPAMKEIIKHGGLLAWYPDYTCLDLVLGLKNYVGCDGNQIGIYSGSDSALCDIANCYLEQGETALLLSPTYDNFRVYVSQHGGLVEDFHLNTDGTCNYDDLRDRIATLEPKIVYIVNPNNPYGNAVDRCTVVNMVRDFPSSLFIIDEAYIDFDLSKSIASEVSNFENIVVTRTFSKAFGLAGVRVGYVVADKNIIVTLNKIRKGKNVSMLGQKLALHALENPAFFSEWFDSITASKRRLYDFFDENNIKYFQSDANFILFLASSPDELCAILKSEGVFVRNRNKIIDKAIRMTIGEDGDTAKILGIFKAHRDLLVS
jgi:histidinol-phosphate aminotransferase